MAGPRSDTTSDPAVPSTEPERIAKRSQEEELQPLLLPGEMVDQYRVLRPLGRGGMGQVYLARDTWLGRRVALKVLHPQSVGSPRAIDRFMREARTTARFNHAHIVTVYGVGQHAGSPYVALEYLQGENLRQRSQQQRLSIAEAVRISLAVAQALQEAHRHQVLHRDLKPENVMLPHDGRIRVVDFGLAEGFSLADGAEVQATEPDNTGGGNGELAAPPGLGQAKIPSALRELSSRGRGLRGTPAYMAPEQWQDQPVSGATDVWALGIMLFELVSGHRPFSGTPMQLAVQVCRPEPVPPLDEAEVPGDLARLIAACLHKDAGQRADIGTVVDSLGELLAGDRVFRPEQRPFRGLLPYDERHAGFFFGREVQVAAFLEALREEPVQPVVGPSGAGKSSFIQAGVIPRLREQGGWLVLRMRPGRLPLRNLAAALLQGPSQPSSAGRATADPTLSLASGGERIDPVVLDEAEQRLTDQLQEAPARLTLLLGEISEQERCRVVLLVDQLEEIYTLTEDECLRTTFMEAVCQAADDPAGPLRVVFTLRDDFLGRLAATESARRVLARVTVLGPPEPEALAEILTRPLALGGWRYDDPTLVEEMVAAVQGEPAVLPLLQVTGDMLWQRRDQERRLLCRAAYDEMGGVAGALAHHADGVLDGMSPPQLRLARSMLLRLVTSQGTRRILTRHQLLDQLAPAREAEEALRRLVHSRLVLARKARQGGDEAELELVHESLITSWGRLARWQEESREELVLLEELGQAAGLWQRRGRRQEELWHGDALYDALRGVRRCSTPVPAATGEFLAAAQRHQQQRQRRRRRLAAGGVGLLVLLALVLACLAIEARRQRSIAEGQRWQAELRRAEAELEGAQSAFGRGDLLEARAKLRTSMEIRDCPVARSLWWELRQQPLRWRQFFWVMAWEVVVSRDGSFIAAASSDGSLYLLDPVTRAHRSLRGHGDQVYSLDISPDGKLLVSGCKDGQVRVWDLGDGSSRLLPGHDASVRSVAFSPDGRYVASAGGEGVVRLWQVAAGALKREMRGGDDALQSVCFSPDGRLLAVGGNDETVRLLEVSTGAAVAVLEGHDHVVVAVAFSPDGRLLASAGRDRRVRLWETAGWSLLRTLEGHTAPLHSVAFSPDGATVVSTGRDSTIRLWQAGSGEQRKVLRGHDGWVSDAAFAPDGRLLVSCGYDAFIRLWDTGIERRRPVDRGHGVPVFDVSFSADGQTLASAGAAGSLRLWEVASGRQVQALAGHGSDLTAVGLSPDGALLASGGMDRMVLLWDLTSSQPRHVLSGHRYPVSAVSFSPDGALVASSGWDGTTRLWDADTGAPLQVLREHPYNVWASCFSNDGELIATATDRTVRLWRVVTGEKLRDLATGRAAIRSLGFSPDDRLLAGGGDDRKILLWEVATGNQQTLAVAESRLLSIDVHPDGTRIGYTGADGSVRLRPIHEAGDGESVLLGEHRGECSSFRFSPDGRLAATAGDDGTVRVWDVRAGRPLWRTTALLHSPPEVLTHSGWQRLEHQEDSALPPAAVWRQAVERDARLASQSADGQLLCVGTWDRTVQLWDLPHDRLLRQYPAADIRELVAAPSGCLARDQDGRLRMLGLSGHEQLVAREVRAVSLQAEELLVAGEREVSIRSLPGGERRTLLQVDPGITALCRSGGWLLLGYHTGAIERRSLEPGRPGQISELDALSAGPVRRLLPGPGGTVVAGFDNGQVGIWSLASGTCLHGVRLHGAVVHLLLHDHRLTAVTELGDRQELDLGIYLRDRCDLLREVWNEVPVGWENGQPALRSAAPDHPCYR